MASDGDLGWVDGPILGLLYAALLRFCEPYFRHPGGQMNPKQPRVELVALVATRSRSSLLLRRALASIAVQRRSPERVIVVDDSRTEVDRSLTAEAVGDWRSHGNAVELLRNRRTPGAAGAWNTGLDHLLRTVGEPHRMFVAILDDDDEWDPEYLARVEGIFRDTSATMVATGFERVVDGRVHRVVSPPATLDTSDFLVGNPGLQPTNTVVRLDALVMAGCFDEALKSCTDRDLWVRLSDLGTVEYRSCSEPLARHYACTSRVRLSTPGSSARKQGLDEFFAKWSPRMNSSERAAFVKRAASYFKWTPSQVTVPTRERSQDTPMALSAEVPTFPLVIGLIADPSRAVSIRALLGDIEVLRDEPGLAGLDVVVLENSTSTDSSPRLATILDNAMARGLRVHFVTRVNHIQDAAVGAVPDAGASQGQLLSIADARTVLQSYLYVFACNRPGAVVWILDDDMRLAPLTSSEQGNERRTQAIVPALARLRAEGVDIAIGQYTGAAPLPFATTMRVQLVDLVATLRWLVRLDPDAVVPDTRIRNTWLRYARRDFYYDLSRSETDRLESPFLVEREHDDERVRECLQRVAQTAERILAGEQVFRPLVADGAADPGMAVSDALHRGGNTFVFDVEALRDIPNPAPVVDGRSTRRSDMIWALLQRYRCRRVVQTVSLAVYHDRSTVTIRGLDERRVVDDIRGFAIVSALADHYRESDSVAVTDRVRKYIEERFAAFQLSFYRVQGLIGELGRIVDSLGDRGGAYKAVAKPLSRLWGRLSEAYASTRLAAIRGDVRRFAKHDVERFVDSLDAEILAHQDRLREPRQLEQTLVATRVGVARQRVLRLCNPRRPLELLGCGAEGVVFSDGVDVFKSFDYWKARTSVVQRAYLRKLVGRWRSTKHLYCLEELVEEGNDAVLIYSYEPSKPYRGGYGPGFVGLLVECYRQGVECRNLHPNNLRVVGERVRLIDYGSDIHPLDDAHGFEMMCRRAWLSWRWWARTDLKELMRASLGGIDSPFMDGYPRFRRAVNLALGLESAPDPVESRLAELQPRSVLDYGCGKGKLAAKLAEAGVAVTAYDPDPEVASRVRQVVPTVSFQTDPAALPQLGPFDVVVCRRVLCVIEDDAEVMRVLKDLRRGIAQGGRVLIGVCHPSYGWRHPTPEATPRPCAAAHPERRFVWVKQLRSTGRLRKDVHRPERVLRRMFARAGFVVCGRYERETVDLERFEPAADQLVFELAPSDHNDIDATLLIKACAMEATTIGDHVRHLVRQLETPRTFVERILVLDSRSGGFLRQHAPGDSEHLAQEAAKLVEEGWVDRVLEGPDAATEVCGLYQRWFGERATETHAVTGAQVASTLAGFEACRTRYLLQVDADIIVGREDRSHDYLADMRDALEADELAVTVAFNIASRVDRPYTASPLTSDTPWRVEVRFALLDLERLRKTRPWPNQVRGNALELPWHRALDKALTEGRGHSLRGGRRSTFFIHPPNQRKHNRDDWLGVVERVEAGVCIEAQRGDVDLVGDYRDWFSRERAEPYIFIVAGRNVPPGRFRRCLESLLVQTRRDWGAIIIDDASHHSLADEYEELLRPYHERITLVRNYERRGLLANMVTAIRACSDPESVVITLDADDALLGKGALERVAQAYEAGADLTVGSMLRTDKHKMYPVQFENARTSRGGNVWQHLRTFKKYLFDAIPDESLRLDGAYVDLANDWAYMLPLVELASCPVWLREPLYLYEPSGVGKRSDRDIREATIARIVAKSPLTKKERPCLTKPQ